MNQKNLNRLDYLVELGKKVKQTSYNPEGIAGTFVDEELANKWGTSSLSLLENLFGKNSNYYIQFNNLFPKFLHLYAIMRALGILEAARDDYKSELSMEAQKSEETENQSPTYQQEIVERILKRFHLIAKQIRSRHDKRPTLEINKPENSEINCSLTLRNIKSIHRAEHSFALFMILNRE
jgi:hypothetical protein